MSDGPIAAPHDTDAVTRLAARLSHEGGADVPTDWAGLR